MSSWSVRDHSSSKPREAGMGGKCTLVCGDVHTRRDIVHNMTRPPEDCIATHPGHCTFDGVTSEDDAVPGIRGPEFEEFATGT